MTTDTQCQNVDAATAGDVQFSDIVKCGILYIKNPPTSAALPFSLQSWKKRYVVLSDTWSQNATSLNIFLREPVAMATTSILHHTFDLRHVINVGQHTQSKRFHLSFFVEFDGGIRLLFGVESEIELNGWVAAVKTLSDKVQNSTPLFNTVERDNRNAVFGRQASVPPSLRSVTERVMTSSLSRAHRSTRAWSTGPEIGRQLHEIEEVRETTAGGRHSMPTTSILSFLLRADSGVARFRRGKFRNRGNQDSGYSDSFDSFDTETNSSVQYLKLTRCAQSTNPVQSQSALQTACHELHDLSPVRIALLQSVNDVEYSLPMSPVSTSATKASLTPPSRPRCSPSTRAVSATSSRPDKIQIINDPNLVLIPTRNSTVAATVGSTWNTQHNVAVCPPKPPPRPLHTLPIHR